MKNCGKKKEEKKIMQNNQTEKFSLLTHKMKLIRFSQTEQVTHVFR